MIWQLLSSADWDQPFFKILANNDTGAAKGHQGGAAIPKELRKYFPSLHGAATAIHPTVDKRIIADLYLESIYLATVSTRYQFQTWGATRKAESRLTDNLGPIRAVASADDILLVQRSLSSLNHYRLVLVRKTAGEYPALRSSLGKRRWGSLSATEPMTQADFEKARQAETDSESLAFNIFETGALRSETHGFRVARSVVFREKVKALYVGTCAICSVTLTTPNGSSEFQAAHIVPRSLMGVDDARNGLGLCRRHHWAFDQGLFGIDAQRNICVPASVRSLNSNHELTRFAGNPMREASDPRLIASTAALKWHMEKIVSQHH